MPRSHPAGRRYILDISPLRHVPSVTVADPGWGSLGWLTLAFTLFMVIGFAGYRRRDIA